MTDPTARDDTTDRTDEQTGFRDAEAFLAELGVERRPIVVRLPPPDETSADGATGGSRTLREAAAPLIGGDVAAPLASADTTTVVSHDDRIHGNDDVDDTVDGDVGPVEARAGRPVSVAEATRIATETVAPDEIATALGYVRRSTASQPSSEGRLRARLRDRGHDEDVVDVVLDVARRERLVDDDAMSAALVAEWRAKGHAPRRIREDLRRREFDEDVISRAVGELDHGDHAAMAFQLARQRAESLGHLPSETAYRRVAGYVARRGYGEGLARKAARDAVYDQRHDDRVAGH